MKRSIGVTIAAALTLLGSLLMLLTATLMVLAVVVMPHVPEQPELARRMMYVAGALCFALAGWGIATGIGLLRLQSWSRISVIVFAVLLLIGSVPALPIVFVMPFPIPANTPATDILPLLKIILAGFYLLQIAIGIWWLILFTRKRVTAQFVPSVVSAETPDLPSSIAVAREPARPVSISVIAWFLIAGAGVVLISAATRYPAIVFGLLVSGWVATAWYLLTAAIEGTIGIGLLRLNPKARIAAIAFLVFGFLNAVLFWVLPGRDARMQAMFAAMPSRFMMPRVALRAPIVAGLVLSFLFTGECLWFLIKRRQSFLKTGLPAGTL